MPRVLFILPPFASSSYTSSSLWRFSSFLWSTYLVSSWQLFMHRKITSFSSPWILKLRIFPQLFFEQLSRLILLGTWQDQWTWQVVLKSHEVIKTKFFKTPKNALAKLMTIQRISKEKMSTCVNPAALAMCTFACYKRWIPFSKWDFSFTSEILVSQLIRRRHNSFEKDNEEQYKWKKNVRIVFAH